MSSSWYTNKRRVLAEASITKVEYPGKIAYNNDAILSARNCSPDYSQLDYLKRICCNLTYEIVPGNGGTLDGGNSTTNSSRILEGGNSSTEASNFLDGGNS